MNSSVATVAGADLKRLADRYRERAQKYERTARVYLYIIIFVLSACILIFAGADRLAGALFKTAAEREVEAVLRQATMQTLRNLSAASQRLQDGVQGDAVLPAPAAPRLPSVPPAPAAGVPAMPPGLPGVAPSPMPGPAAGTAVPKAGKQPPARATSGNEGLHRTIKQLYEDNAALHEQLAQARGRLGEEADRLSIEELRKDAAVEVAQIRANVDESRASADRDIAQAKADVERAAVEEATRRAEDLNALIASSVARVGAAVIVILLVRIFLRDRQRLILLGGFYLGLADAIEISGGDPARLKEWLPQLVPPAVAAPDDVPTPIESVMQAVVELAKRGRV